MADISTIKTPDGTSYDIKDSTAREHAVYYGTCSTLGETKQKEATVNGVTELYSGLTVAIKFTEINAVANPTLKVNSLDAKAIKRYGTTAPSTSAASSWNANSVITLTYDGTYWQMHDWINTTYSSMSESEMQTGTAGTARTITAARLKQAVEYHAPVTSVNGSTGDVTVTETDPVFTASAAHGITSSNISAWNGKQEALVSGTNIKTINNTSLLGSGNIDISGGGGSTDVIALGGNTAINTLSTSVTKVSMSTTTFNEGSGFSRTNGGIECLKSGIVHVVGKVRFSDGFTANDYIVAKLALGSTEIAQGRTRIPFAAANGDVWVEAYVQVTAGNYIYLQALNASGARGKVPASSSTLSAAYVTSGSSGGGGGSSFDPTEVNYTFSDFKEASAGYSIMPGEQQALVDNVVDGIYTSLDEYMNVYAQMICGLWDYNS